MLERETVSSAPSLQKSKIYENIVVDNIFDLADKIDRISNKEQFCRVRKMLFDSLELEKFFQSYSEYDSLNKIDHKHSSLLLLGLGLISVFGIALFSIKLVFLLLIFFPCLPFIALLNKKFPWGEEKLFSPLHFLVKKRRLIIIEQAQSIIEKLKSPARKKLLSLLYDYSEREYTPSDINIGELISSLIKNDTEHFVADILPVAKIQYESFINDKKHKMIKHFFSEFKEEQFTTSEEKEAILFKRLKDLKDHL